MKIKLYRVVLNILFYVFYVLLTSIAFSFIFPTVLVILWQDVISPIDPIFDRIQIAILILVLLFTLLFRKYFYLPIKEKSKKNEIKKELEFKEYKKKEKIEKKDELNEEKVELSEELELDIKIGKEIK